MKVARPDSIFLEDFGENRPRNIAYFELSEVDPSRADSIFQGPAGKIPSGCCGVIVKHFIDDHDALCYLS